MIAATGTLVGTRLICSPKFFLFLFQNYKMIKMKEVHFEIKYRIEFFRFLWYSVLISAMLLRDRALYVGCIADHSEIFDVSIFNVKCLLSSEDGNGKSLRNISIWFYHQEIVFTIIITLEPVLRKLFISSAKLRYSMKYCLTESWRWMVATNREMTASVSQNADW
jgi:hypothetical protein